MAFKKWTASPPGFDVTPFPLFCKYELSSHKAKNRPRISSKSCTNVLPGHWPFSLRTTFNFSFSKLHLDTTQNMREHFTNRLGIALRTDRDKVTRREANQLYAFSPLNASIFNRGASEAMLHIFQPAIISWSFLSFSYMSCSNVLLHNWNYAFSLACRLLKPLLLRTCGSPLLISMDIWNSFSHWQKNGICVILWKKVTSCFGKEINAFFLYERNGNLLFESDDSNCLVPCDLRSNSLEGKLPILYPRPLEKVSKYTRKLELECCYLRSTDMSVDRRRSNEEITHFPI